MFRSPITLLLRGLFAAGLCVAVSGCDEKLSDITGPTQNLTPTFSSIQNDIFANTDSSGRTQCVTCHTNQGRAAAGGLNLVGDGYNALVNRPSIASAGSILVIPGDPENSYLIKKLKGSAGIVGLRMPRNGPPFLTDGQITVIERWIQEGARNN